ncbi:opacity-associated protein A [Muribacter muris]|uniref:Opacity-associated protein A n=1 Tax=Muribacter muris TaxID=67855 RepID=A0A4Y9K0N1_9PAST|nr:LysM-like peptidoglycan-binding domain-containing protein [Muribacter muris]MBF0784849.1 opacity-associated protein A [Muribacter muris]MBF0826932.1 opacity-associated protein A [Muribacter muris]TFV11082.1 opacity-associated protein A [Muribacter muris]
MNQNKSRIEPTFGEKAPTNPTVQNTADIKSPISVSVSSNTSPGHTFTPVLKRPAEAAQTLSTLEEKAMLNENPPTAQTEESAQSTPPKAAGFAFSPVEEKPEQTTKPAENPQPTQSDTPANDTAKSEPTNSAERVIPAHTTQPKKALTDKVPPKFRRLLLVLLLALALLLVFFLLKPNTPKSVEALQEQGTSLPIEFRPVDEAEAKRAEEEARALQVQQTAAAEQAQQAVTSVENNANVTAPAQAEQPAVTPPTESAQPTEPAATAVTTVAKPVAVEPIKKPDTSGSVIYQPETAKAEPKKVERLKPTPPKTEPSKTEKAVPPVKTTHSTVKPKTEPTPAAVAKTAEPTSPIVSSKTLTVPKGVSLMQVFRDNNLNISDVNAMSKVNNAVSNLKVGEKVTVRLDKNGRVAEMSVSAGKYIRQANGSYTFK